MGRGAFSFADYEARLATLSPNLPQDLREAASQVSAYLSDEGMRRWAEEGVALAGQSLRSWEAASEYFRASPRVAQLLSLEEIVQWVQFGRDIADQSSIVSAAYFHVSPETVGLLSADDLKRWAAAGQRLYQGNWKSISLATLFFSVSPSLLPLIGASELSRLEQLAERLAERSYELANACLEMAPNVFPRIEPDDRGPLLDLAEAIGVASWADVRLYFENCPDLIEPIESTKRTRFLRLSRGVAQRTGSAAYSLFSEAAAALAQVDPDTHGDLIALAEELAVGSPAAAMEFLKSAPEVLSRIPLRDLTRWQAAGHRILKESSEGGEAFFRLQSGKGEQVLEELSPRVELSRVAEILRLYCKALTGANVSIHPSSTLTEKGIGWVAAERPSTEGTAVYLPETAEEFNDKVRNFAVYKVYSTHQAGHLEFGSFQFTFKRRGRVFPSRRRRMKSRRDAGAKTEAPLTDMERFFDLFPDRQLASDLFTIAEDARVDFLVKREYPGIRRFWRLIQGRELERRPHLPGLPLREAFLENLVRASLDGFHAMVWPQELGDALVAALRLLRSLQQPQSTVEDAAEATLRLYDLAVSLPNVSAEELEGLDWQPLGEELFDLMRIKPKGGDVESAQGRQLPQGAEETYESPQPVDFRGDFKPELVQLLMRLRLQEGADVPEGLAPLTAEQLRELMEKSVEITVGALAEGDLSSAVGLFLTNLEKEAGTPIPDQQVEVKDGQAAGEVQHEEKGIVAETKEFWYDEWDFRASDYKPRWCRVLQRPLDEGDGAFFEETLRRYSTLAAQTRKQFEQLRPELFRKIKRLHDGEDFDLDLVIEYMTEKRAGHSFTDKVYWRRNKVERQVAVAFLLDMSASTDEEIEKRKQKYVEGEDFGQDARKYYEWLSKRKAEALLRPPKRIIDLEKESMVLLIGALEAIGDDYGIYGFSGYGRDNVEFYILKDLAEPLSDKVKARIDKTEPIRSTRMGPAIRHATAKLEEHDAKVRILFLVSDGRPQDHGYGRDRTEREYAINDTHQALMEAKRKGIVPFCLTVDREGHEYLGQMCEDIGYEILGDIEALPGRLPTLYRRLTE
jgi:nitric oxide reductase NorD protein